ncbi:hypothetical protein BTN50_0428 [Candidatus Enterovibrio altilux]|uniref:Uncharacterized protein n=1 Tax=Candidatus Enterovibrio altilux TaxID=1927128 RepID=A0A291B7I4_9GAMM|nr:hypothetical protein BTN50_0428 [Candidatus Enterovibrio luxaltus]
MHTPDPARFFCYLRATITSPLRKQRPPSAHNAMQIFYNTNNHMNTNVSHSS